MRIYFAGCTAVIEREKKNLKLYNNRLISYFYISPGQIDCDVFEKVLKHVNKRKRK